MKLIFPITITDSVLDSSNVAEPDTGEGEAEWASGTTYADGDQVILVSTHKVYESVQGSNTGNDPSTDDGTFWVEVSATNRFKAFDKKLFAKVKNDSTITYSFIVDDVTTGVALFGLTASSVRVRVLDDTSSLTEVYDSEKSVLDSTDIVDWFTYFFEPIQYDTETLFTDLPAYKDYTIEVTIDNGSSLAEVGQIVVGRVYTLGTTAYGTSVGIEDFSTKERNTFGDAIIQERAFAQEVDFKFFLNTRDTRRVSRLLSNLRATPAVYFSDENHTEYGTTVYGFYRDFQIPLSSPSISEADLLIEGLT